MMGVMDLFQTKHPGFYFLVTFRQPKRLTFKEEIPQIQQVICYTVFNWWWHTFINWPTKVRDCQQLSMML